MTPIAPTSSGIALTFGPFRLLPLQRLLMRGNTPLRLGSRAREILFALVERAGEIVKKSELIARVWPDTVVEEATLRVHIAALRKALGDSGEPGMRYVENITGHGYRFVAAVAPADDTQAAAACSTKPANNLPAPLVRMVGRENVVATLARRLPCRRFVTLAGAGGIGKTTVAVAAAHQLRSDYAEGIYFVDLAACAASMRRVPADPARDANAFAAPTLVSGAIAAALGLSAGMPDPLASLIEFISHRAVLLVLDNCEHVVEAAALISERLLAAAPNLHILATSREPLRATNEWVLRLAPLELPTQRAALTAKDALSFSALQLFAERATANLDTFTLTDIEVPVVVDICRRLDGLPLAIELAAAQVSLLGVRGLAAHLDDYLGLLTRGRRTALPRHQTLRATLEWSFETLSSVERVALARLAVFSASFDVASASAVIVDGSIDTGDVLDVLNNLAAKSLLNVRVVGDHVLYDLLKTARAYALEKLDASGEGSEMRRRYAKLRSAWRETGAVRRASSANAGGTAMIPGVRTGVVNMKSHHVVTG